MLRPRSQAATIWLADSKLLPRTWDIPALKVAWDTPGHTGRAVRNQHGVVSVNGVTSTAVETMSGECAMEIALVRRCGDVAKRWHKRISLALVVGSVRQQLL